MTLTHFDPRRARICRCSSAGCRRRKVRAGGAIRKENTQISNFAYAQHYCVHVWPQPHFASLPQGSRAIDAFIGEPSMLGIGHGAKFLRVLAEQLMLEGASCVAVDPAPENIRAVRAYRRAGFRGDRMVETERGPAVLMILGGLEKT